MVLSITVRQCVFLFPDSFTVSAPTVFPVSNDSDRYEAYMLSHVSLLSADILPSSLVKFSFPNSHMFINFNLLPYKKGIQFFPLCK